MKILILLILSTTFVFSKTFTPQELTNFALEHAPIIQAQLEHVQAQQKGVSQAKILGNPIITFQAGTIKSGAESAEALEVTIGQPLPWPGKREAKIKSQEFLLGLSKLEAEEIRLRIAHRVYTLSIQVAAYREIDKRNIQRKQNYELVNKYLRNRKFASPKLIIERDLIDSQIKMIEKDMINIKREIRDSLWELKLLTNKDIENVDFDWKEHSILHDESKFLEKFKESLILKKLNLKRKLAENKVNEARLENRPDIVVGFNYRKEDVAPANHFYHGQLSIVIPIVDRGQHTESMAKAELRKLTALNDFEALKKMTEVKRLSALLQSYQSMMKLFPLNSTTRLESNYKRSFQAFKKGQIDATTFLQSDSQIHESLEQIYLTRNNYFHVLSELQYLVGKSPEF